MTTSSSSPVARPSFMQTYMVWPKLIYFWLNMAIYTCTGLLGPYMKENWKFSSSQVGLIMALQGVNFFGSMFWTSLADKTGRHRTLLIISTLMSAIFFAINGIPQILMKLGYFAWKSDGPVGTPSWIEIGYSCVAFVCYYFFNSALFPLVDSAMLSLLGSQPGFSKDQFGRQRLFGSPAHSFAGLLSGGSAAIVEIVTGTKQYQVIVYQTVAFCTSMIFATLMYFGIPAYTSAIPKNFAHHGHKESGKPPHLSQATALPLAPSPVMPAAPELDTSSKKNERSPVFRLLTNISFLFYLLFIASAGIMANTLTIYQQIYIQEIGTHGGEQPKKSLLETATTRLPASLSEIVVYFFSKDLIAKFGPYWMLLFSQFFGIVRMMSYACLGRYFEEYAAFKYAVEVIKGLNSGFIVSAGVRIAGDIAPAGCSTTAQGLFSGIYKGAAFSLAGLVGFFALPHMEEDLSRLFYIIGIFSIVATTCFFFKFLLIDRSISLPGMGPKKPKKSPVMTQTIPSSSSFGSVSTVEKPDATKEGV